MRNCSINNCHNPVFRTDKLTNNGYCHFHWRQYSTDLDKRSPMQKFFDSAKSNPKYDRASLILEAKELDRQDELKEWFKMVAHEIKKHPYCMECGTFIPERYYRHASAHIVSKSIFKSVATNENNFLILGASCGCHHKFDNGGMQEMNVFEEAVRRYSLFADQIKERHKHLEIFNQLL